MAVRWYCRFRLSAANVRDLLAERGIDVSARTVLHWVQKFAPMLARAGRRAATRPGVRWWCDETYVRVGGNWAYLYRAIDEQDQTIDVLLRTHRDLASARAFFILATYRRSTPDEIITDKHLAYVRAIREEVPKAIHTPSGLHRASGPETRADRAIAPADKGARRPRAGGPARPCRDTRRSARRRPHAQARTAVATFDWLADGLRVAA